MTDNLAEAEGILVRSAAMHDLELPKGLRAVARAGAGVNNIPLDKCAEAGVVVFNTPGANANGVKELVLAGMLLGARDVVGGIDWCKEQKDNENISKDMEKAKKKFAGHEIRGKKLGVIGLGAIGAEVANAAAALGMEVYGYDPFISVKAAWMLSRDCLLYTSIVPGHMNLDKIVNAVKLGVAMAGGTPVVFPAIAVCDGIAMGHVGMKYSLVTRDLIADSTECMALAHQFDALVMVPNCDKNVPGLLMAAADVYKRQHQDRFRHTAGNIVHFQLFIKWVKKSIGDWFQRIYLFQIGG